VTAPKPRTPRTARKTPPTPTPAPATFEHLGQTWNAETEPVGHKVAWSNKCAADAKAARDAKAAS
jgi:hypothetical protein